MTRDEYIRRFDLAAKFCREFGQQWIIEPLPEQIKFDIEPQKLEIMRDGRMKLPWGGRLIMPNELIGMDYIKARKIFWVDGSIPLWINFYLIRVDGDFTVILVHASMEITNDDTKLYPFQNPPFHVLGPPRKGSWEFKEGVKFSFHDINT